MATITKPIVLDETVKECNRNLINVLENMTKASESAEKAEYAKDISVSVLNSIRDLDVGETLGQGVLNNITELNKAIAAYDSKNNVVYNLFDKDAVTTGGFYNSYGAWTSNAAYCETDFIPCVANEKIAVYNYSKYNQALNYYRSDKTRIALNGNSTGNEPYFTVPDNADIRYVRIALSNSAVNTFTIVRGDTPPTKYYPFGRNFDLLTSLENDTNRAMKYKQLYSTDAEKYGGLISNFENMTMYYTSSSFFTDAPLSVGAACVTTLRSSGTVGTVDGWQEALYPNLKRKFIRYIVAGEFSTWNEIKIMEGKSVYGRYIAFGDSLSVGQMWNEGADGQTVITICPEESKIPTRIAFAAGCQSDYENISKGGAGFLAYTGADATPTYAMDLIQQADFSGAYLTTLMFGTNDASIPLGDKNSEAGDGTIIGEMKRAISYIRTKNNIVEIVIIPPYPKSSSFTTKTSGGWSCQDWDDIVAPLCEEMFVGYCSWKGCSILHNWHKKVGANGNYAHPRNQYQYRALGNFIAGKVSTFFKKE